MKTNVLNFRGLIYLVLISVLSTACMSELKETTFNNELNESHWLIGDWMYMSGKDTMIEQWYFVENGEFDCVNVKLKNGDSIPNEKVSLRLVDEELVLEVKVKDQNNGEGVPFTLNLFTDDLLIFDNEEHDFPQTIQYKLTHKDSCTASIIGTINNENRRVDFSLIRLPD